ncbi:hypothetical protein [Streptococcus suis]|uniref:hypothetical protein n=1 Tax=Streptococcus suis TaxID=1307 RepID=UPI001CF3AB4D|nr:hypothetical protein [Streptococcus suis]
MLTFRELEQIAEILLENTTSEEMQCYLDMEHDSKLLLDKIQNCKSGGAGIYRTVLAKTLLEF